MRDSQDTEGRKSLILTVFIAVVAAFVWAYRLVGFPTISVKERSGRRSGNWLTPLTGVVLVALGYTVAALLPPGRTINMISSAVSSLFTSSSHEREPERTPPRFTLRGRQPTGCELYPTDPACLNPSGYGLVDPESCFFPAGEAQAWTADTDPLPPCKVAEFVYPDDLRRGKSELEPLGIVTINGELPRKAVTKRAALFLFSALAKAHGDKSPSPPQTPSFGELSAEEKEVVLTSFALYEGLRTLLDEEIAAARQRVLAECEDYKDRPRTSNVLFPIRCAAVWAAPPSAAPAAP